MNIFLFFFGKIHHRNTVILLNIFVYIWLVFFYGSYSCVAFKYATMTVPGLNPEKRVGRIKCTTCYFRFYLTDRGCLLVPGIYKCLCCFCVFYNYIVARYWQYLSNVSQNLFIHIGCFVYNAQMLINMNIWNCV